ASGIGREVAADLARHGARIAAGDIDPDGLATTTHRLEAERHKAHTFTTDITDTAQVEALFDRVETLLGPITTAISAAGALTTGPVTDCTDHHWHRMIAVNATGVFAVGRAAARRMGPRGHGSLVTIASNAAGSPRSGMAAYAASKAAAVAFTKDRKSTRLNSSHGSMSYAVT